MSKETGMSTPQEPSGSKPLTPEEWTIETREEDLDALDGASQEGQIPNWYNQNHQN
jgi:hypothetical protein